MMRWIVGTSLKFRFLVVAASAALMVFGVATLRDSPVDVFPEFAPPKVEVQTRHLGLTAEEIEELVTVPMEQALTGMPEPRRHPLEVGSPALGRSCCSSTAGPTCSAHGSSCRSASRR